MGRPILAGPETCDEIKGCIVRIVVMLACLPFEGSESAASLGLLYEEVDRMGFKDASDVYLDLFAEANALFVEHLKGAKKGVGGG